MDGLVWDYYDDLLDTFTFPVELTPGSGAAGNLAYLSGGSFLKSEKEEGGLIYEVFADSGNNYGIIPLEFIHVRSNLS